MPQPAKKKSAPAKTVAPATAAEAFDQVESEVLAVDPASLIQVNADIPSAVSVVLGAEPQIRALRADIHAALPKFDLRYIDNLRAYAFAVWYAYLLHLGRQKADDATVKSLVELAQPLRENLLVAAEALAHRGLLDADRVAEIRAGHGHIDTANDLVALSTIFRAEWAAIHSKTAVEEAEVDRAGTLGPELLVALSVKDGPLTPPKGLDTADLRTRAFTLFASAYDECRRAVTYLRWHEADVDAIAPNFYARQRRAHAPADSATPDVPPAPAAPPIA